MSRPWSGAGDAHHVLTGHDLHALALVLVFIGGKIFWNQIVGKVDPAISLGVTLALIAGGVLWSLWKTRKDTVAVG